LAHLLSKPRSTIVFTFIFGLFSSFAHTAQAASIPITVNLNTVTTSLIPSATTLAITNIGSGTITTNDSSLNAAWNPVSFYDRCMVDLSTGQLTGTAYLVIARGDTLIATETEDVSAVITSPTQTGPYTGSLVFIGGTGIFGGASGSVSGGGLVTDTGGTSLQSGTLVTAPVPEPAPAALILCSFLLCTSGAFRKLLGKT
jgi:hypothetical protein